MRLVWLLGVLLAIACALSSCKMSADTQYVREKIPIEIQSGRPATITISSLSGNGWNDVGIRCSPDVWAQLTRGGANVGVRLTSSDKDGVRISDVSPGSQGHKLWPLDSYYYLFAIDGKYRSSATVELTFAGAPDGRTRAEILVLKTPADTGL